MLGSFLWGPADRLFGSYKVPVLISLFASARLVAAVRGAGPMPFPLLVGAFVLIGFSTGPLALVLAHGRSLVPPHLLGRTITLLNIGAMGGGFLVQFISGAIIDLFPVGGWRLPAGGLPAGFRAAGGSRSDRHYCLFRQSRQHLGRKSALR